MTDDEIQKFLTMRDIVRTIRTACPFVVREGDGVATCFYCEAEYTEEGSHQSSCVYRLACEALR